MADERELLLRIAGLASNLGPALVPGSHDELLDSITSAAKELFEAAACSLALLDDTQRELIFHVAVGAGAEDVKGLRMPVDRGIAGWVVAAGQPIAIEDVTRDPRFAADVAERTGYVPRSILAMPLQTDREMLGAIEVLDRRADRPGAERDLELLAIFARQAALAIENSRIFRNIGQVLFAALARASDDSDLTDVLGDVARDASPPADEIAEIAGLFNELAQRGRDEHLLAAKVLTEFLRYTRRRR